MSSLLVSVIVAGVIWIIWCVLATWWHLESRGEESKEQLLRRHRELRGEGDECPWSIRLTAADKREAMRQARVDLGLERPIPPPTTAEIEPTRWVEITHPTSLGMTGRVTLESYEMVWRHKGWIIVPADMSNTRFKEVLIPRAKWNPELKVTKVVEHDPRRQPPPG